MNTVENEDSIFNELQFHDIHSIKSLFKKFEIDGLDSDYDYKNLHNIIFLQKLSIKVKSLCLDKEDSSSNISVTVFKILILLEINKINLLENSSNTPNYNGLDTASSKRESKKYVNINLSINKVNTTDLNELLFTIYSNLLDESSQEIRINVLNTLINIIFDEISPQPTYEEFTSILDNQFSNCNILRNTKITYENFIKNFRVAIYYYFYSEIFLKLYDILDHEEKKKILTAELIVCLNKVLRNLEENNINLIFTKKLLEIIDINQAFITKSEYIILLIKSYNI
jgi:hypothetical protein